MLFSRLLQNGNQDFDFSIAMNADNLFYVKFIATEAPTFFGYIISVLTMVKSYEGAVLHVCSITKIATLFGTTRPPIPNFFFVKVRKGSPNSVHI